MLFRRILPGPLVLRSIHFQVISLICMVGVNESRALVVNEPEVWKPAGLVLENRETEARDVIGVSAGAGFGTFIFGGKTKRDFLFLNVNCGHIFTDLMGEGRWWGGRLMVMGEGTVGWEQRPNNAEAVSLTSMFRYLWAYPARVVPFLELGAGVTWTNIGSPDLGGNFQFNTQGGAGAYWFAWPDIALTIQYRFVHYSNAGFRKKNSGVNFHAGLVGVSYFF